MIRKRTISAKVVLTSAAFLLVAVLSLTGIVMYSRKNAQREELAKETKKTEENRLAGNKNKDKAQQDESSRVQDKADTSNDVAEVVDKEGKQRQSNEETASIAEQIAANKGAEKQQTVTKSETNDDIDKETAPTQSSSVVEYHFGEESSMVWPVSGNVLMNYSMDSTIYFATLEQYKYNPALIIQGAVNDKVVAAADGVVTDVSVNEETGCTVSMDIGNGYSAVYGQLKEVNCKQGDRVEAGAMIGHISEPTKYYSVEGSNIFFEVLRDGEPVDPLMYLK